MSQESPHTSAAPAGPQNRTHTAEPHPGSPAVAQNVALLVVPKSWTRLVVASVSLLALVVFLVIVIVFLSWGQAQANSDRILDLQNEVTCLKAHVDPCPRRKGDTTPGTPPADPAGNTP
jgi:hypothetical protein